MKVLYISYDGATDPLGQSQIIPYLKSITDEDIEFILLSFDKASNSRNFDLNLMRRELARHRINWISIPYHKNPKILATFYDFIYGLIVCIRVQRKNKIDLVHGRSFIGAILALFLKKFYGIKFLLDYRGLWPDERIDAGEWKKSSILYKIAQYLEKALLQGADEIVVLTKRAADLIASFPYLKDRRKKITVIPTCADLKLFRSLARKGLLEANNRPTILYLGSLGTWYMLDEMVDFFSTILQSLPTAHFLFLTQAANQKAINRAMADHCVADSSYSIQEVSYSKVPEYISMADISIFFIKPLHSKISSSPTKLGESLACGLPVVINSGIGDCDQIVNGNSVGIVIDGFNSKSYQKALLQLEKIIREQQTYSLRCRETAERFFSLERAANQYKSIYRRIEGREEYEIGDHRRRWNAGERAASAAR